MRGHTDMGGLKIIEINGASLRTAEELRNVLEIVSSESHVNVFLVISSLADSENALERLNLSYFNKDVQALALFEEIKEFYARLLADLFNSADHPIFDDIANTLIEIDWMLEDEPHPDADFSHDQIISVGHLVSSKILAAMLNELGINTRWVDARGIIHTDNSYRNGKVNMENSCLSVQKLSPLLKKQVLVAAGALGGTSENYTTTLGSDGLDYSAALIASCLNAESLLIVDRPDRAQSSERSRDILQKAGIPFSVSSKVKENKEIH